MSWEDIFAHKKSQEDKIVEELREKQKLEQLKKEIEEQASTEENLKKAENYKNAKKKLKEILSKSSSENIAGEIEKLGDPLGLKEITDKREVTQKDLKVLEKIIEKSNE